MNPIDPDQQLWQQRLSDYLDDRLDVAERAEIERLIQGKDESEKHGLHVQLDQMRYLRDSLKQLDARDSRQKLDAGFADRVLEAAVGRAIEEGEGSEHPLIRLASQPGSNSYSAARSQNSRGWNRRTLVVALSIAASIALAVFVVRRDSANQDLVNEQPLALAQNDANSSALRPAADRVIDPMPGENDSAAENTVDRTVSAARPGVSELAALSVEANRSMESETVQSAATQPSAIGASERSVVDSTVAIAQDSSASKTSGKLSAVMVLEVKQTESGRIVGAVRRAMREAGMKMSDQKALTAEIAETASQTVGLNSDEMVSMVYLQVSAKSIDQFYGNLFGDRAGIESVSLALATNAPVLDLVNAVDVVDATTIKSGSGSATMLSSDVAPLADLDFAKTTSAAMQGMALSSGPDFAAQLIVVIR